jgi:hypothetical protein
MPLYHTNQEDLPPGSIVQPGAWGGRVLEQRDKHQSWKREIILEAVRLLDFPDKPSRFNATFSCELLETIRCYHGQHCPQDFIYEVELVDPAAPQHKGDFNAVEPMRGRSETFNQIAVKYWLYSLKTNVAEWPGVECSEIVSASPLRILKRLA